METLYQSILRFIDETRKMSPAADEADREFIRMFQYVQCYARSAEGADRALEASATAFFRVGCYWQCLMPSIFYCSRCCWEDKISGYANGLRKE